jgi:hypothetical protein
MSDYIKKGDIVNIYWENVGAEFENLGISGGWGLSV